MRSLVFATITFGLVGIAAVQDKIHKRGQQPPPGVTVVALSPTALQLTWSPVPKATGYLIYRAPAANGPWAFASLVEASGPSFIDRDLVPAGVYYYKVEPTSSPAVTATIAAARQMNVASARVAPAGMVTLNEFTPLTGSGRTQSPAPRPPAFGAAGNTTAPAH